MSGRSEAWIGGEAARAFILSGWRKVKALHQRQVELLSRKHHGGVAVGAIPRRRAFVPMFMEHPKIETHYCYRCPFSLAYPLCGCLCARKLEEAIKRIGPQYVAAFLAEPIVGSTVGALPPPDEYWPMVREICDRCDVLLIADEVMTGFGRTGKNFAVDHWGVIPDIIACAKGMAAGYVPTGGVIVKDAVVEVIKKGSGAFPMAHTYCGNPVSGAAVEAVIKYVKAHNLVENARLQGELLGSLLKELGEIPIVGEVRGKGLLWGVELVADKATKLPFPRKLKASGVVTRECMRRGSWFIRWGAGWLTAWTATTSWWLLP